MKALAVKLCVIALLWALPAISYAADTPENMHAGAINSSMRQDDMRAGTPHGNSMIQDGKHMADMEMTDHGMVKQTYSDRAFLSAMIPHHEGALVMAEEVLKNGKDLQVKKWAEEVISSQTPEIKEMREWLKALGGRNDQAAGRMEDLMRSMRTSPMSQDPDRNFVEMMIGHHAGALEMATVAIVQSTDRNILKLSKDIIETQARDIYNYQQWLLNR